MPFRPASEAMSHLRVIDLTRVRSGPTCVRQFADWGADVIKIEQPAALEADGALGAGRATGDFQNLHRNKRSMTLNLKDPAGHDLLMRLVETADVVVENFRPDVKNRLGIDYEALSARNPRIILASISGFGQTGPYAKRPGFDQIAQGMGGLMSITGAPGEGPMRVGIPVADLTAGLFAALGILTALVEREKSGRGQWVHTSLLQAQTFMLDFQAARWLMESEVPGQAGNEHPTSVPTNVYRTSDGAVNVAVSGDVIWERFAQACGCPEWIENPDYKDADARRANRVALNAAIAEVMAKKTSAEWVDILLEAWRTNRADLQHRSGVRRSAGHASRDGGTYRDGAVRRNACCCAANAASRTSTKMVAGVPDRGANNDELLEELGLPASEIAALRERNVI
jgi:crotonobetainyl-CoA:carnitine CoA-transferase CaiB-like acyl-CoA transferase